MTLSSLAPLGVITLGLVLGIRHAADADHVIAVSAIVCRERRFGVAARLGLAWGVGHALTVVLVGTTIIFFKVSVPARLGLALEFAVALVLIALGISAVRRLFATLVKVLMVRGRSAHRNRLVHSRPELPAESSFIFSEIFDGRSAGHSKEQSDGERLQPIMENAASRLNPYRKAFAVGLIHGLAGSTAIALLVLGAIPEPGWAAAYLGVFAAGTILGMVLITTVIGAPFVLAPARMAGLNHTLAVGSGLLSFGFGLFLAYHISVVGQLFGPVPLWVPR
jgi:hypothetical protein